MAQRVVARVGLLAAAAVAGGTFAIWRGYDPGPMDAAAFVQMHQGAVRGLNTLFPVLGALAILSAITLAVLTRRQRLRCAGFVAAAAFLAVAGLVTRFGNQPINAVVMGWSSAAPPEGWQALRDGWWSWHLWRTAASGFGFALMLNAALD